MIYVQHTQKSGPFLICSNAPAFIKPSTPISTTELFSSLAINTTTNVRFKAGLRSAI